LRSVEIHGCCFFKVWNETKFIFFWQFMKIVIYFWCRSSTSSQTQIFFEAVCWLSSYSFLQSKFYFFSFLQVSIETIIMISQIVQGHTVDSIKCFFTEWTVQNFHDVFLLNYKKHELTHPELIEDKKNSWPKLTVSIQYIISFHR
jgi:hypothetical protein